MASPLDLSAALDAGRVFALGLGLGVLTGIPLGVVNVAVVERARRDGARAGAALGLGGAIADAAHAALATVGTGAWLARHRGALLAVALVGAASIAIYAGRLWRGARSGPPRARPTLADASRWRLVGRGLSLTLPNPAALLAWSAIATALWPGGSAATAVAAALGVGGGSAAWFAVLARLAGRRATPLSPRWSQAAAAVLVALAAVAVIRVW